MECMHTNFMHGDAGWAQSPCGARADLQPRHHLASAAASWPCQALVNGKVLVAFTGSAMASWTTWRLYIINERPMIARPKANLR